MASTNLEYFCSPPYPTSSKAPPYTYYRLSTNSNLKNPCLNSTQTTHDSQPLNTYINTHSLISNTNTIQAPHPKPHAHISQHSTTLAYNQLSPQTIPSLSNSPPLLKTNHTHSHHKLYFPIPILPSYKHPPHIHQPNPKLHFDPNSILTQTPSITSSGTNPFAPHCIKTLTQIINNKIGSYHFNLINYSYPVKILLPSLAFACTALFHVSLLIQIHYLHLELLSLQTSEPSHHRHSPFHGQKSHPLEKTLIIQQPYSTTLKLSHTTTSTNFPSHLPCLKHFILT
jgi:hypothetical protein